MMSKIVIEMNKLLLIKMAETISSNRSSLESADSRLTNLLLHNPTKPMVRKNAAEVTGMGLKSNLRILGLLSK